MSVWSCVGKRLVFLWPNDASLSQNSQSGERTTTRVCRGAFLEVVTGGSDLPEILPKTQNQSKLKASSQLKVLSMQRHITDKSRSENLMCI